MAFVRKHWEIDGSMVEKVTADPDSVEAGAGAEFVLLDYLTRTEDGRKHPLGRFVLGTFEASGNGQGDVLHTGSVTGGGFEEIARGSVLQDHVNPDGLYEIYVPL